MGDLRFNYGLIPGRRTSQPVAITPGLRRPPAYGVDTLPRPDLIGRDFTVSAAAVNSRWYVEITYVATGEGWLFLSVTWNQPCVSLPAMTGLAR